MRDMDWLTASHPLFLELRKNLLWHCTSVNEFKQIQRDAYIKPNDGSARKWGHRLTACQQFDAVSLFDFATEPADKVLSACPQWHQFLSCDTPLTIILGIEPSRITGRLVRYPENKDTLLKPDA